MLTLTLILISNYNFYFKFNENPGENPHIADVAVIEGKTHIWLTWRLLSTVSINERANQSGFSTLSVNGIKIRRL